MAITTDLTTAVGQVRAELGDDTEGNGVLPSGGNLTDAQIAYALTAEGDEVGRAVARLCEWLANRYALLVTQSAVGRSESLSDIYEHWKQRAADYRGRFGGGVPNGVSIGVGRVDAYTDNANGQTDEEYADLTRKRWFGIGGRV